MALQETFYCGSESSREAAVRLIRSSPLYDDRDRQLIVIVKRARGDMWSTYNRKFHGYVNMIAAYKEVPAPAVKETLKAHLAPLVEQLDVVTGEVKHVPKGVSQMDDDELKDLCQRTVKLAKDTWDIPLPVTDEEYQLTKYGGIEALMEREAAIDRDRERG